MPHHPHLCCTAPKLSVTGLWSVMTKNSNTSLLKGSAPILHPVFKPVLSMSSHTAEQYLDWLGCADSTMLNFWGDHGRDKPNPSWFYSAPWWALLYPAYKRRDTAEAQKSLTWSISKSCLLKAGKIHKTQGSKGECSLLLSVLWREEGDPTGHWKDKQHPRG